MMFRFGGSETDFVEVTVLRRSHPEATDYWDGNWLACEIRLQVGGFAAHYRADLRTDEIATFAQELAPLYQSLRGTAALRPMEEQLILELTGDGRGGITVLGQAQDVAGTGHRLKFELGLDQTALPALMRQLGAMLRAYPVHGSPAV